MTVDELYKEIEIELGNIEQTINELNSLLKDLQERKPTTREITSAGAFLAQFYSGIENILKRICKFHKVMLPKGNLWHVELFKRFQSPSYKSLPTLFDESFASQLAPYRKFRHVFFHGYGFQLDWNRIKQGIEEVGEVFIIFKKKIYHYIEKLQSKS
ncbi:MAG: hypothetical protein KAW92_02200 [Candidatus Cloacimonetes bacterium]|nr:hypothetical protein [Candidatus Cloacimonadota bacterium]